MSQLSSYIHHELHALLRQVHRTPHKKHSSLARVEALIRTAPLPPTEKDTLTQEIREVQTAISATVTPTKSKATLPRRPQSSNKTLSGLQLSPDPQTVKQLLQTKLKSSSRKESRVQQLQKEYEDAKATRLSKQRQLQKRIIRVQRMQRMKRSQARSAETKRQEKELMMEYQKKQESLRQIKKNALSAAKQRRKDTVQKLMQKYHQVV